MTDSIEPVTGASATTSTTIDLSDIASEAAKNKAIGDSTSRLLVGAIERAAASPAELHRTQETLRERLTEAQAGDVGRTKTEIVSEIDRSDGTESVANPPDPAEGVMDAATAMTQLVTDLTTWQITWNVAQSAQKDLTHVLKSS